ncbi:MAG: hypothetical protein JWP83_2260 [Mycobacterium sp.]|jgi:hypothetical protein|nr:hypothetical protein [Mycobacterium sp.]
MTEHQTGCRPPTETGHEPKVALAVDEFFSDRIGGEGFLIGWGLFPPLPIWHWAPKKNAPTRPGRFCCDG